MTPPFKSLALNAFNHHVLEIVWETENRALWHGLSECQINYTKLSWKYENSRWPSYRTPLPQSIRLIPGIHAPSAYFALENFRAQTSEIFMAKFAGPITETEQREASRLGRCRIWCRSPHLSVKDNSAYAGLSLDGAKWKSRIFSTACTPVRHALFKDTFQWASLK